jgi:hypothetical protein
MSCYGNGFFDMHFERKLLSIFKKTTNHANADKS